MSNSFNASGGGCVFNNSPFYDGPVLLGAAQGPEYKNPVLVFGGDGAPCPVSGTGGRTFSFEGGAAE